MEATVLDGHNLPNPDSLSLPISLSLSPSSLPLSLIIIIIIINEGLGEDSERTQRGRGVRGEGGEGHEQASGFPQDCLAARNHSRRVHFPKFSSADAENKEINIDRVEGGGLSLGGPILQS